MARVQWEYKIFGKDADEEEWVNSGDEAWLNKAGRYGWEICGVSDGLIYLKRRRVVARNLPKAAKP